MTPPVRLLCSLLPVLLGASLLAQASYPITVRTVDGETGEALPFVNVQLTNSAQGGTTDLAGVYRFRLPAGRTTILASFLGYDPIRETVLIEGPRELTFTLEPAAATLETVTVSSDDASERLARPLMGVERLSSAEITALPVALGEVDVFRGLQLVSGVNSAGEASNGLSVRGGTIDQNLVLLDGAPIFTPTHLFGLFSVFTPDAIGSVDLYRANIPSRYGGRVSSVVDVKSRNPTADGFRMQGGIGIVSTRLSVETPLTRDKRLKVLAAGRVGFNDFAFQLIERLRNTRSSFVDGTLKLRYRASERSILTFSGFYSNDFYQIDLINTFSGITAENNQYAYSTANAAVEWLRQFGDRLSLSSRLVSSDHRPRIVFPQLDTDFAIEYASRIRYRSARSALDLPTPGGHRLTGGLELVYYDIDPGRLDPGGSPAVAPVALDGERATEASLFAEDEWRVSDRLTVSAGLRYTRFDRWGPGELRYYREGEEITAGNLDRVSPVASGSLVNYGGFEPRLGLSYRHSTRVSAKLAYARNRQYLQNIFNSTTPLPSSRWKLSDNNVLPQTGQLYSAGLYALVGTGRGYELSLEGYLRRVENLLEYKPGAEFFLNPTVETDLLQGQGRTYGLELGLRKRAGKLTGQMNYAYARAENRVEGPTLTTRINGGRWYPGYFDQPHTFNTNFTFDDGLTHRISLNLVVQNNRPYSVPNGYLTIDGVPLPIFLERNNGRLPLYHRLDLSWTVHNAKMKRKRWVGDWTVTLYNLYGRKNAYNIYYQPRRGGGAAEVFGSSPLASYQLTIFGAPIVSLAYSFKFR